MKDVIPVEVIENRIFFIRGQKVMIDRDLAELYGVETKYLNRQVRRNRGRFPEEFMFQLIAKEKKELVTICHRFLLLRHSTSLPYAFTEHGVAMLASVLHSERAIKMSVYIIKAFVRLRQMLLEHKRLNQKITEMERKLDRHDTEYVEVKLCDELIKNYDIAGRQLYKLSMAWTRFKQREGFNT